MLKRITQITAVVLTGLVLSFFILETGLRLMGAHKESKRPAYTISGPENAKYTILCLGDSNTFGLGAPEDKSYPVQLARRLNNENAQSYRTINAGRPGNNTSLVLESAKTALKTVSPDLVIILAGANNYWNFSGYRTYNRKKDCFGRFFNHFYSLKTVKLFALTAMKIQNRLVDARRIAAAKKPLPPGLPENLPSLNLPPAPEHKNPDWEHTARAYEDGRNFEQAQKHYKEQIAYFGDRSHDAAQMCFRLGCLLYQNGRFDGALSAFRKSILLCPDFADNYHKIGLILFEQGRHNDAVSWFIRAMEINPESDVFYHHLGLAIEETGGFAELEKHMEQQNAFNPCARDTLALIRNRKAMTKAIEDWIVSDLTELAGMFKKRNIKVIFQGSIRDSELNNVIKRAADMENIPYVDNAACFENLFADGVPERELLAEDFAHANTKGYALMVENILTVMKQNGLLGLGDNKKDIQ